MDYVDKKILASNWKMAKGDGVTYSQGSLTDFLHTMKSFVDKGAISPKYGVASTCLYEFEGDKYHASIRKTGGVWNVTVLDKGKNGLEAKATGREFPFGFYHTSKTKWSNG